MTRTENIPTSRSSPSWIPILSWGLLGVALVLGAWLRSRGLLWGLPESYYFDEEHFVKRALAFGTGDLNPHWFHKPAFFMYVLFIEYGIYYGVGSLTGLFSGTEDFAVSFFLDPGPFYLIGRSTVCCLGVGSIVLVHQLGWRLFSPLVGSIAALVFAVNPGAIEACKVVKADAPSAFLGLLSLVFLCHMLSAGEGSRKKRHDILAGFFAGLGTATKYYPMVLGLPLVLAHITREIRSGRRAFTPRILLGPFALLLGFFVGSPYNFLDSTWIQEAVVQRFLPVVGEGVAVQNDATYMNQGTIQAILDFGAVLLSADGMGMILGGLSLLGLVWFSVRGGAAGRILVSVTLFFSGLCVVFNPSYVEARHLAILYPILAVSVGFLFVDVGKKFFSGKAPWLAWSGVLLFGVIFSAVYVVRESAILLLPDARNLARTWFEAKVPAGSKVLLDEGHVKLRPTISNLQEHLAMAKKLQQDEEDQAFTRHLPRYYNFLLLAAEKDPSPRYDIVNFYHPWWKKREEGEGAMNFVRGQDRRMGNPVLQRGVNDLDFYLERGYRYVVTKSDVYKKYLKEPMASDFPSFNRFYRSMEDRLELIKQFGSSGSRICVFRLPQEDPKEEERSGDERD